MYADRADAGEQLADHLIERGIEADIVLGIPRGGLPVASVVADRLGLPLDVVVAKKIAHPENPEYAVGAVTADGVSWYDDEVLAQLGLDADDLEDERDQAIAKAAEKLADFRGEREQPELAGRHVLVVDDGIATGATMRACVRTVDAAGAARVTAAVPVAPPTAVPDLEVDADEVIALETPERFRAVGQFYQTFEQVATEEALRYLEDTPSVH